MIRNSHARTLLKFEKKNALEKAKKPEPKDKTMTVAQLIVGLEHTEACIKVKEDIDWKEQGAATTGQKDRNAYSL
jgi:hypothetical protein